MNDQGVVVVKTHSALRLVAQWNVFLFNSVLFVRCYAS